MIVQKNFLSKLRDFGLNTYESKLWTALLSRGISTAGELSDIANVPRSRTYDVLESLEKKGFIIMKIGKPIKYLAVPPEEVVERVKKKVQEEAETRTSLLEELRKSNTLTELNNLHKQGYDMVEPNDLIGSFKGRKLIYDQMESMIKNAKESIILMTSTTGISRKKKELIQSLAKAKSNNISIKIAAPITKENIDDAKEIAKYAEVKHTDNSSRFCIIDGEKIMFMLMDDNSTDSSYDLGVWAETKPFLSGLQNMFDLTWDNLTPLDNVKF
jgi:sugar-specific transcriptional regulator TrmB|tara:strand:- start:989 stop:1801 length:813 start_codon:yes stop_codon:yes gene_type:complete